MRIAISFLLLCLPLYSLAQSKGTPTPEQLRRAELERLRSVANAVYSSEVAREKAGDCPNVKTNYDFIMCLSHEEEITQANYKAFTTAFRAILAFGVGDDSGLDKAGPTGNFATPATNTAAFDLAETAWHTYATAECDAVDTLWRGGTIVNSAVARCNLRAARARLHELDSAYEFVLHPR